MADPIVRVRGVSKRYFRSGRETGRSFDAVAGVDLDLVRGELVELAGRSGSGKSTLLNMVAGLLAPTEGTVQLDGTDLYALGDAELSELRNARIGVVPQGQTVLHGLTAVQNVLLPYTMYREPDGAEARALDLLDRMGMKELADTYPAELSGGEIRRVAIARALVCEPDVLLADEPTGDLDDENTAVVLQILRETADAGKAVMLVTHEQEAARYSDRVWRMDAGALNDGGR